MRRRALAAAATGFVLAAAAVLGGAQAASAHDTLTGSDPGDGDTVTSLPAVTMDFSAALLGPDDESANLAQVTGSDGLHFESDCAAVDGGTMTVPVALGAAGEYTVSWRVVSSDGHPVSGEYTFAYAPEEGTDAAAGSAASACAAVAASEPADADGGSGATGLAIGLGAGAVVLAGLAVVLVVAMRRSRPSPDGGDDD